MKLGGFGDKAIPDSKGNWYSIHCSVDFYLRSAANLAYVKGGVPEVSIEEISWSGVEYLVEGLLFAV
jgi:tetrathionate reductase subunit A